MMMMCAFLFNVVYVVFFFFFFSFGVQKWISGLCAKADFTKTQFNGSFLPLI